MEERALKKLIFIIVRINLYLANAQQIGYQWGIQFIFVLAIGLYTTFDSSANKIIHDHRLNPWWFAVFHTVSAWNNVISCVFS